MVNDSEYNLGESEEENTLKKIFLKPFTSAAATYEFSHEINLDLNPLYKLSAAIFDNEDFTETSKNIHQHLKSVSKHPNIKDGDLFILKYKNLKMNNKFYEALGIYKVENKNHSIRGKPVKDGVIYNTKISGRNQIEKFLKILRYK